jgi:hypothetical protein
LSIRIARDPAAAVPAKLNVVGAVAFVIAGVAVYPVPTANGAATNTSRLLVVVGFGNAPPSTRNGCCTHRLVVAKFIACSTAGYNAFANFVPPDTL